MWDWPALRAALQPLHLYNGFSQLLFQPLDLQKQRSFPAADLLQLGALLWAQVRRDCGETGRGPHEDTAGSAQAFHSLPTHYTPRPLSHRSTQSSCCPWHSLIAGPCLISFTLWCEMEMQTWLGPAHMGRDCLHTGDVYIQVICGVTDDCYDSSWCLEGLERASRDRTEPNPQQLRKQRLQAETHTLTLLAKHFHNLQLKSSS